MTYPKNIHPELVNRVNRMIELAEGEGFELRVVSAYRSHAEQDKLFKKRPKVTNARGGQSWHNFGLACDVAPVIGGKVCWDEKKFDWSLIGKWAKKAGLEWGGNWRRFKDRPHVQLVGDFKNTGEAQRIFGKNSKLSDVWNHVSENITPLKTVDEKTEEVNDLDKLQELVENPPAQISEIVEDARETVDSAVVQTQETVRETIDSGNKQIEKATTEITNTFEPKNIPAYIPRFGIKNWLLGLLPAGGLFTTVIAYIQNAPQWLIFLFGVITGVTAFGFFQLAMKHKEFVGKFILNCYDSLKNPNEHNLIPTQAAQTLGGGVFGSLVQGARRESIEKALAATKTES